jgi:hypothetical protein
VSSPPDDPFAPARRARTWERFAEAVAERSPLYARLARGVAGDLEVDGLLRAVPSPPLAHPTLLLAAVHDLLLAGVAAPGLRPHYPSLPDAPARPPAGDPWPAFRACCLEHADLLRHTIATRRTQTNEVGRSSLLLVALAEVQRDVDQPIAWLDVGASAGLSLRLDRFHHDLRPAGVAGDPDATVRLRCEATGSPPAPALPDLAWRAGLDAAPVDVDDPAATRWLEACVWPEQTDRLARLRAAVAVARAHPVPLHRGDAVDDLPAVAAGAPDDAHLVVTHTWVLAYLEDARRAAFERTLDGLARGRDLDRIGMEGPGALPGWPRGEPTEPSRLLRSRWRAGTRTERFVADVDDHGRWLRWR